MDDSFQSLTVWVVEGFVHYDRRMDCAIFMEAELGAIHRLLCGHPCKSDILFQMRAETNAGDAAGEVASNHNRTAVVRMSAIDALKTHEATLSSLGLHPFMRMAANIVGFVELNDPLQVAIVRIRQGVGVFTDDDMFFQS